MITTTTLDALGFVPGDERLFDFECPALRILAHDDDLYLSCGKLDGLYYDLFYQKQVLDLNPMGEPIVYEDIPF